MFNKKVLLYLLITFLITWCSWFALASVDSNFREYPQIYLFYLGGLGPTISALIVVIFFSSRKEVKEYFQQIVKVKVNIFWYLFIIITPLLLIFIPWLINTLFIGKQDLFINQPLYKIFSLIPLMIIGGGLEELGWRGLLLPELMEKKSVIYSNIVVAIIWVSWHIPLWFIDGLYNDSASFIGFAVLGIGLSLLLSIVYIKTRSIFMCIMFHTLINTYLSTFITQCSDNISCIIDNTVKFLICLIIFLVFLIRYNKSNLVIETSI